MKFMVFIALSFVAIAVATPLVTRARRQDNSGCTDRTNLASVLQEVGNLLTNLLDNLPLINQLNLTGNGDLLNLTDLLIALSDVLTDLLGTRLNSPTQGLVDLLDRIIISLNKGLGGKPANQWACKSSDGSTGSDLASLVRAVHLYPGVPNLLLGLVQVLISLLSSLLRGLGIPIPANFGIPVVHPLEG